MPERDAGNPREELPNPDGAPCEMTGATTAKTWKYWFEDGSDARHWMKAGEGGTKNAKFMKELRAKAKAAGKGFDVWRKTLRSVDCCCCYC